MIKVNFFMCTLEHNIYFAIFYISFDVITHPPDRISHFFHGNLICTLLKQTSNSIKVAFVIFFFCFTKILLVILLPNVIFRKYFGTWFLFHHLVQLLFDFKTQPGNWIFHFDFGSLISNLLRQNLDFFVLQVLF